jgi:hypothetical protein
MIGFCPRSFGGAYSETMNVSEFEPSVAAEAKQSDIETAEEAAISRLGARQDGLDFWADRCSEGTGPGVPAPG